MSWWGKHNNLLGKIGLGALLVGGTLATGGALGAVGIGGAGIGGALATGLATAAGGTLISGLAGALLGSKGGGDQITAVAPTTPDAPTVGESDVAAQAANELRKRLAGATGRNTTTLTSGNRLISGLGNSKPATASGQQSTKKTLG